MTTVKDWAKYYTPDKLSEPEIAKEVLGPLLRAEQLSLLLGAGVSEKFGLPGWNGLVTRCARELGDTSDYSDIRSAADLMGAIDQLRRRSEATPPMMFTAVRKALYSAQTGEMPSSYSLDAMDDRLLTALGALMMSSARGSAGEVFTLNFDDVLEWYLDLHGFRSEVVCELPQTLRGGVDVHVFHIHGFIPLMRNRYASSSWMILSRTELEGRLAKDPTFPWEALLLNRLQSKVFLIIGTSMSDTDIRVSLTRARKSGVERPLGFVLGVHDDDQSSELRELNLVPVRFDSNDDIPGFLLEVCQLASRS